MAGSGITVHWDEADFRRILAALAHAAMPDLAKIADFAGAELDRDSTRAFAQQADPVTGKTWEKLHYPRYKALARSKKKTSRKEIWGPILDAGGQLRRSRVWEAFPDGSVVYGSTMVYARIHQMGGTAGRGNHIPARPYMGVTKDFDRRILLDPAVLALLGVA